jgi:exodeoxyribonuclease VII large subunit
MPFGFTAIEVRISGTTKFLVIPAIRPVLMQNRAVANTYLNVSFKDKDAAKSLGARWDSLQRQWFVPEGRELALFAQWLPKLAQSNAVSTPSSVFESGSALVPPSTSLFPGNTLSVDLTPGARKGISLSSLLAGVSQAVAQAYRAGVWTLVEVVELRSNGGHVFMDVSERDSSGSVLAKSSAVIWQSTANVILPEFERATGAELAAGIKLLVRARPVFKPLHGFSIEIDAIDPEYTLGDLEARKREIRERLEAEGVFTANKQLPTPWDFNAVLVVAPEGGAGLGDFQAEANRLERFGVCRFTYVFSRFQGEGAAKEIADALQTAIDSWVYAGEAPPDAVVIIRGGGAVNDMAWLNDYDLARLICDLPIPVLTGIGHERDNTVLDEVANIRFDTPSKVAAGIEQFIAKRVMEARSYFDGISQRASQLAQTAATHATALDTSVRADSLRHMAQGKQQSLERISSIRLGAMQAVRSSAESARETLQQVKSDALAQLSQAQREVPLAWGQIAQGTGHTLRAARVQADGLATSVLDQAGRFTDQARSVVSVTLENIESASRQNLHDASARSEGLIREISGQGPDKTLKRGFALVRSADGKTISRASQTASGVALAIEFSDGTVTATADKHI